MPDEPTPSRRRTGGKWLRRYPPLFTFLMALVIMLVIMPSALNLPQANPSTVLEYAPVPPEDDDPPPPQQQGSLSSLTLGSSNTLETGSTDELPEVDPGLGEGDRGRTKQCVGDPPRQTEDPNSPPCVPFFEGDNGGATWQGVTGDEIVVLVYASTPLFVDEFGDNPPEDSPPAGSYCDVDKPPDTDPNCLESSNQLRDHFTVRITRAFSKFFNERFQTYGRHVHFWVYYSSNTHTPSSRRADAHDNWQTLKPFAVIDDAFFGGHNAAYAEAMARRKVSVYSQFSAQANEVYRQNAPFLWTFWPDVEHWVDNYVSYVCRKVAPYPVRHSGNASDVGQPRRYGLLSTGDESFPGLQLFARLATERLEQGCPNGHRLDMAGEYRFPNHQFAIDSDPAAVQAARSNVAQMQTDDVTTVLWLGGYETEHSKAMTDANWLPEIVVAGDLLNDRISEARHQDQEAWSHAWVVSNLLREDVREESPCRQAFRSSDPRSTNTDLRLACPLYRAFFMLFRAVQVAGPFLTPDSVDQGNHSIPATSSDDPFTAACFYDPGDFSCVKDAEESWWDPDAPDPDGDPEESGCWRMANGGERYLPGEWEGDDGDVFANPDDVCNNVIGDIFVNATGGL